MTHIARQNLAVGPAHPVTVRDQRPGTSVPAIRIVHRNQGLAPAERGHPAFAAGRLTRLARWWRNYLSRRRTLKALDRLSDEQLKDIGFRRPADRIGGYERLP